MAGRRALPVCHAGDGTPAVLRWQGEPAEAGAGILRLTVAVDHRMTHRLVAANAGSGEVFGVIEVLYGCPGQVFECPLDASQVHAAFREGLALSLEEPGSPLWMIAPGGPHTSDAITPHLFLGKGNCGESDFLGLFCSPASIQPCDWMGGCVLDGLWDWARRGRDDARLELERRLRGYFDPQSGLRENNKGMPADGEPPGPESTGPWAVLALATAKDACEHPALALADKGFDAHYSAELDSVGKRAVAETSYNIAYPMMALAVCHGREALHARALRQLRANMEYLTAEDDLWLRYLPNDGSRTFQNWSRGVAWYFLGLVRTLALLPAGERPPDLLDEAGRVAGWVAHHQLDNGIWPCFLKEPDVLPDTSGSAGIAAAIAIAANEGMIDPRHRETAQRARQGLSGYLAPGGWLRGVSQSNKRESHEMDIQRMPYRVIAPWGMGLFAQLLAALHESSRP